MTRDTQKLASPKILLWVVLAGLLWWGYNFAFGDETFRYRMTIVIKTPEGDKTGSAVREVTLHRGISLTPQMTAAVKLKGEAVVVDLGKRGTVFGLLSGYKLGFDYASDVACYVLTPPGAMCFGTDGINRLKQLYGKSFTLEPEWYPQLVRFRDPKDPKSVENLLKLAPCTKNGHVRMTSLCLAEDNFANALGEGIQLKSVVIEMTKDPVTSSIRKFMPSYQDQEGFMRWFNSLPYGDLRRVGPYDLTTGE